MLLMTINRPIVQTLIVGLLTCQCAPRDARGLACGSSSPQLVVLGRAARRAGSATNTSLGSMKTAPDPAHQGEQSASPRSGPVALLGALLIVCLTVLILSGRLAA